MEESLNHKPHRLLVDFCKLADLIYLRNFNIITVDFFNFENEALRNNKKSNSFNG